MLALCFNKNNERTSPSAFRGHAFSGLTLRLLVCHAALAWTLLPALADEAPQRNEIPGETSSRAPQGNEIPSFAELETAGAVIGEIRIDNQNIFDLNDPKESNALFRLANSLHIRTRPGVIARSLLFKSGEPVSVRVIDETERLLRANRFLYDVRIRPVAYHDGVVDIEVVTRDTWTLAPSVSFGRAGGKNSSSSALKEYNLMGTGIAVGLTRVSDVDRSGTQFQVSDDHAFDGWTSINYTSATYNDGKAQSATLDRPFYALDTRWAAGASASTDERIDSIYNAGTITAQYRHRENKGETYGGWSRGLVDGWTNRYSIGLSYQDDRYELDPTLPPPAQLPADQKLVAPFFRYELIEDNYEKLKNRDLVERPEYFAMGFNSRLQLGRAMTGLGSTRDLWLYSGTVSKGFEPLSGHNLLTSASLSGQYGNGRGERIFAGGSARYYLPQGKRVLFFSSLGVDTIWNPDPVDALLLGGDNGLRGYPLRYQSGDRRVLLTVEERIYTNVYLFRIFRVGGAVFYDVGRAWGGPTQNTVNSGWLSDVGFGLRFFNVRTAFGNTLHADFAFPLNHDPAIQSFQFLLKTRTSF